MSILLDIRRRTVRAPSNPLDKATIISIYPRPIDERKHTIEPGFFHLDPGTYENPSLLVVGPSSWWKEVDAEQPLLEIPHPANIIADSIVRDWANGLFMCNMADVMPGVFFIPGVVTAHQLKTNPEHKKLLDNAKEKQIRWFSTLVQAGDVLWARSNENPLSISNDMRLAAQELNLKDKSWMGDFTTIQMQNCPACGSLVRPGFPICANCKTIVDKALYDKLGLKQAV